MRKKIISSLVVMLLIGTGIFPVVGMMKNEKISDINNESFEGNVFSSETVDYTVGTSETFVVTLNAGGYIIKTEGACSEVEMDGFGSILNPGKPKLPYRTFLVGLPPGGEVISVELIDMETLEIPGSFDIVIVPSFVGAEGVVEESTYGTFSGDEVYPDQVWNYLGMGQMRKYDFARISFCPMSYYGKDGKLVLYERITLKIDYEIVKEVSDELLADRVMDELASEMIINYHSINSFYSTSPMVRTGPQDMGYVIITVDSLKNSFDAFIAWKEYLGYTIYVVTKEEITAEYPGFDPPEKIRNFLIEKYLLWGLKYVLIVGTLSSIPARDCYPKYNDHSIKVVTEHYYADLTGDWDSDGDGYYGERMEDNWDVYPEVYVGRIPVDDPDTVNDLLCKSMSFEKDIYQESNALLLGAIINYKNQDNSGFPKTDGAEITEELRELLTPGDVGITTMYEKEGRSPSSYTCDMPITRENVLNEFKNGYRLVNLHSHGSATSVSRFVWMSDDGDDVPETYEIEKKVYLDIDVDWDSDYDGYSIIFAGSCRPNSPEVSLSLGESIYIDGPAAVFVGSRTTTFEPSGWDDENDGGIGTFQYHFNRYLIDEKQSCGEALFNAKTYCYDHFSDPFLEYHIYGLKPEGDPGIYYDVPPEAKCGREPKLTDNSGKTTFHAVIVGVNHDDTTASDLLGAEESAKKLRETLLKHNGWDKNNAQLLTGANADANDIQSAIEAAKKRAKPGDEFLFYFANHGGRTVDQNNDEGGDGFDEHFVAHDGDVTDDQLKEWLTGFKDCVTITVKLDFCYSGGFVEDLKKAKNAEGKPYGDHISIETSATENDLSLVDTPFYWNDKNKDGNVDVDQGELEGPLGYDYEDKDDPPNGYDPGEETAWWLDKDGEGDVDPDETIPLGSPKVKYLFPFTKANIEGLGPGAGLLSNNENVGDTRADRNNDGITTTKELFEYSIKYLHEWLGADNDNDGLINEDGYDYEQINGVTVRKLIDNDMDGVVDEDPSPGNLSFWPNEKPNVPNTPSGPNSGKAGNTYTYTTSTTDLDEDDVYYWFDWGDGTNSGWLGPYDSGDTVSMSHSWSAQGSYSIKVKSRDRCFAESDWSDPLSVSMPKNKAINPFILFLERLIERFPILEQILQPIYDKLTGFY